MVRGNIKVAIIRDLPEEATFSLAQFAVHIRDGINEYRDIVAEDFIIRGERRDTFNPTFLNKLYKTIKKYVAYNLVLMKSDYDIYHIITQGYGHLILPLKLRGKKVVITCHDLATFHYSADNINSLSKFLHRKYALSSLRYADKIIADSNATKNDLMRYLNIKSDKISVIYGGINPLFTAIDKSVAKGKYNTTIFNDSNCCYILHVGGTIRRKNIEAVLNTISMLNKKYNFKAKLIKVGDSFSIEQMNMIGLLDIKEQVTHLGKVTIEELLYLYNLSDILLFPSLLEGFGLPIIEAMACGLPVVCSNITTLKEVIHNAGITTDPNNAEEMCGSIMKIMSDSNLRNDLKNKGTERAQLFSWTASTKQIRDVYREIIHST